MGRLAGLQFPPYNVSNNRPFHLAGLVPGGIMARNRESGNILADILHQGFDDPVDLVQLLVE